MGNAESTPEDRENSKNAGIIAAYVIAAIGGILLIIAIILLVYRAYCRKPKRKDVILYKKPPPAVISNGVANPVLSTQDVILKAEQGSTRKAHDDIDLNHNTSYIVTGGDHPKYYATNTVMRPGSVMTVDRYQQRKKQAKVSSNGVKYIVPGQSKTLVYAKPQSERIASTSRSERIVGPYYIKESTLQRPVKHATSVPTLVKVKNPGQKQHYTVLDAEYKPRMQKWLHSPDHPGVDMNKSLDDDVFDGHASNAYATNAHVHTTHAHEHRAHNSGPNRITTEDGSDLYIRWSPTMRQKIVPRRSGSPDRVYAASDLGVARARSESGIASARVDAPNPKITVRNEDGTETTYYTYASNTITRTQARDGDVVL